MKKACCLLAGLLLLAPSLSWAAAPRLTVAETDFSFGQVFQGEKVEHSFRFRNGGDAPLLVERVQSSCGCTAALVSATTIPPGGEGEIRTTFDSGRFSGPVQKSVTLYVNDPQRRRVEFRLRGTVRPELLLQPAQLELQGLQPGETKEARVTVTNQGAREIALTAVQTTLAELQVELASTPLAPGGSAELVVRLTPKAGKGRVGGYVLIRTSSENVPELRLPVTGAIAPRP
jgi:P pilus assembly chaperone PapD